MGLLVAVMIPSMARVESLLGVTRLVEGFKQPENTRFFLDRFILQS